VSNDNPYSESLFKTLKYGPEFPERFGSLCAARQFMDTFTNWYNHEHRHTGIGLHTPADVHFGLATDKAAEPAHGTDRRPRATPAQFRHDPRTQDSRPTRHRLDQPTSPRHHRGGRHASRLTPTGLIHLENSGPGRNHKSTVRKLGGTKPSDVCSH
jgi:putative transposase